MPILSMRAAAVTLLLAASLPAGPPLTTIQDMLYKADGTPFKGSALVSWRSFEAADGSFISSHNLVVRISDGLLRVQLVPTTNAAQPARYMVRYNSDGKIQFEEIWAVPPSALTLRVRDVRIAVAPIVQPGPQPLDEGDIVGLAADLAARPVKSAAYASDRIAFINSSGALEAVSGAPSDCVRVDGSSGPCGVGGGLSIGFADVEVPAGAVDGNNASFTVGGDPNPASSLMVFRNGVLQQPGFDYSATSRTIAFLGGSVPQSGDVLLAIYRQQTAPDEPPALPGPQVLCSTAGLGTSSTVLAALGTCNVPANTMHAGDRLEVRFDYAQDSGASGFAFQVKWAGAVVLDRATSAGESLATGRIDGAWGDTTVPLSIQSWGGSLPIASTAANVASSGANAFAIEFAGRLLGPGGSMSLRNITVIRYPGR